MLDKRLSLCESQFMQSPLNMTPVTMRHTYMVLDGGEWYEHMTKRDAFAIARYLGLQIVEVVEGTH